MAIDQADATEVALAISTARALARAVEATPSATRALRDLAADVIQTAEAGHAALKRVESNA